MDWKRITRWEALSSLSCAAIYGWMLFFGVPAARAAEDNSRVAVLESRSDQIDQHLRATDGSVQRLWDTVNAQGLQLSEMQGEERAAFAILTLLTAGNFVVQISRRRKES